MTINDVFKVFKGIRIEKTTKDSFEAYVIDTKDVSNCVINYSNSKDDIYMTDINEKYFLKPKDIVIASIPSQTTNHVGYCTSIGDEKVIIKKNFFVLRLREPDNNEINTQFVAEYLEYFGVEELKEKYSYKGFQRSDIENIDLPNISIEKQNELVDLIKPMNERNKLYYKLIKNEEEIKKFIISEVIKNE